MTERWLEKIFRPIFISLSFAKDHFSSCVNTLTLEVNELNIWPIVHRFPAWYTLSKRFFFFSLSASQNHQLDVISTLKCLSLCVHVSVHTIRISFSYTFFSTPNENLLDSRKYNTHTHTHTNLLVLRRIWSITKK